MGWARAGDIFDPVATKLLTSGARDDVVTDVLAILIDKLRDGDWDTYDESYEDFRDEPAVVAAFLKAIPNYKHWDNDDGED